MLINSTTELEFISSLDPLLSHLTALAAQDHVAAQALRDPMELVSGVVCIVTPPSTFLCMLEVLRAPHLLTQPRPTTGLAKAQVGVRGYGGCFSIRVAI